ncbi:MAG: hypothetical protein O7A71_04075 [Chloroflexi bacterium]|nr:hypothetical protein [Chloroflexota bacterium]
MAPSRTLLLSLAIVIAALVPSLPLAADQEGDPDETGIILIPPGVPSTVWLGDQIIFTIEPADITFVPAALTVATFAWNPDIPAIPIANSIELTFDPPGQSGTTSWVGFGGETPGLVSVQTTARGATISVATPGSIIFDVTSLTFDIILEGRTVSQDRTLLRRISIPIVPAGPTVLPQTGSGGLAGQSGGPTALLLALTAVAPFALATALASRHTGAKLRRPQTPAAPDSPRGTDNTQPPTRQVMLSSRPQSNNRSRGKC